MAFSGSASRVNTVALTSVEPEAAPAASPPKEGEFPNLGNVPQEAPPSTPRIEREQLIQGLQSGVLRGEEFNSVMEQAPRLAILPVVDTHNVAHRIVGHLVKPAVQHPGFDLFGAGLVRRREVGNGELTLLGKWGLGKINRDRKSVV